MNTPNRPDQAAPSYEFEDSSPASAPAASGPSSPAPAAFNPFADQVIQSPSVSVAPPTTPVSPVGAPAAPAQKQGTGRITKNVSVGDSLTVTEEASSSKDLWKCPRCGAGNQPKRIVCRACGQDPKEMVVGAFFKSVPGIAIVCVLVVGLAVGGYFALKTDTSFHAPGAEQVDKAVRTWGGLTDKDHDLGNNRTFTKRGMISVSGRVVSFRDLPGTDWIVTVVIGLGSDAADDAQFSTWTATYSESDNDIISNAPKFAVLHCLFAEKPDLNPGAWLSIEGERGLVSSEAQLINSTLNPAHYTVKVSHFEIH